MTAHPDLLYAPVEERSRLNRAIVVTIPTIAFVVAIALADPAPRVSLAMYALTPLLYFTAITVARRTAPPGATEQNMT